jgi:hypothetical protein
MPECPLCDVSPMSGSGAVRLIGLWAFVPSADSEDVRFRAITFKNWSLVGSSDYCGLEGYRSAFYGIFFVVKRGQLPSARAMYVLVRPSQVFLTLRS